MTSIVLWVLWYRPRRVGSVEPTVLDIGRERNSVDEVESCRALAHRPSVIEVVASASMGLVVPDRASDVDDGFDGIGVSEGSNTLGSSVVDIGRLSSATVYCHLDMERLRCHTHDMTMNRFFASLAIASFAVVGIASSPIASAVSSTMTVDGVDYPVCAMEDCSDQTNQVGVWFSRSMDHWLLINGEDTFVVTN